MLQTEPNPKVEVSEEIRSAILEVMQGGIEFQLAEETVNDGIRRSRQLVREIIDHAMQDGGFPKDKVQAMMDGALAEYRAELRLALNQMVDEKQILKVAVVKQDGVKVETGLQHKQFGDLLVICQAGLNAYLVGPAGSGKTTAAEMVAKVLGLNFYFTGAITSEFKLTGFIDAQGRVICPAFRKAYEHGGVFLFDEIDASMPQAVLAFNAAIANGMMDFPDKTVPKHKDFYCIAAANTFGVGADRIYVGRNQMDGATIDRFAFLEWNYDETLEAAMSGEDQAEWVKYVQAVRKAVAEHKVRHVVSPRASRDGAKLLRNGVKQPIVEELTLWKGLDKETRNKVVESAKKHLPKPKPILDPIDLKPKIDQYGYKAKPGWVGEVFHRNGKQYRALKKYERIEPTDLIADENFRFAANSQFTGCACSGIHFADRKFLRELIGGKTDEERIAEAMKKAIKASYKFSKC